MITDQTLINILQERWPAWERESGFEYLGNRRWGCRELDESWDNLHDMCKRLSTLTRAAPPPHIAAFYRVVMIANDAYEAGELVQ
jgi:hypothetical protein